MRTVPLEEAPSSRMARWTLYVLGSLVLAGLAWFLWSSWGHARVTELTASLTPVSFFAALTLLPALGAPLTPFFLLAGASFGIPIALTGSLIALTLNLALCYWIARSGLRPRIQAVFQRFGNELIDFTGKNTRTLRFTALVKLSPGVPAFAKHYLLGMAGVPFVIYLAVSLVITGAYAAFLIVLGESIFQHELRRSVVAVGTIGLVLGLAWWRSFKSGAAKAR